MDEPGWRVRGLLLLVGLAVGTIAARGRRERSSADAVRGEIRRIYRVADQVGAVLAAGAVLNPGS